MACENCQCNTIDSVDELDAALRRLRLHAPREMQVIDDYIVFLEYLVDDASESVEEAEQAPCGDTYECASEGGVGIEDHLGGSVTSEPYELQHLVYIPHLEVTFKIR